MRSSIALACILKNERDNLPQLLNSVKGCFDEIHLTDTGSTDGSIEYIKSVPRETTDCEIFLHHFDWINDFSAARNASFEPVKTDYIMWMDLDDVMSNPEGFKSWRDSVMKIAEYWYATYHYASTPEGKPICSFARERVVKRELGCKWNHFIHEGMLPPKTTGIAMQYATNWAIIHKRTEEDLQKDKSRNLKIFESRKETLDPRMVYYYGKELMESGKPLEAFAQLVDAISRPELEHHDRVMGIQYACICSMQLNQFENAIKLAHQGLQLEPNRAEFYVVIADSYLKLGKAQESVPYYNAASTCVYRGDAAVQGALFNHKDSYTQYPLNQLARVYANMGNMDKAEEYANKAAAHGASTETMGILTEIKSIKDRAGLSILTAKTKCEDVVISCHPQGFYEWDEDIYQTRGIGGSETAVVEMAKWIGLHTNRKVLIFNNRDNEKHYGNVSYLPAAQLPGYFARYQPKVNIAWRHNMKLTDAPSYIWAHDLSVQGIEFTQNYEMVFALSKFHKNFIHNLCNVPLDKIWVTSNGIDPKRFETKIQKEPGRIIFSSSPDRGLEHALKVMERVAKKRPSAVLHCYYGFDNLIKVGRNDEVSKLKAQLSKSTNVVFHGNIPQSQLTREMLKSEVWLYPTNFLETYCITAIEALCAQAYPITRKWGALENTLSKASELGMADVLDLSFTDKELDLWSDHVIEAFETQKWRKVDVNPEGYSWENVGKSWIEFLNL